MNENDDWQLECIGIKNRSAHILETGEISDCTFLVGDEPEPVRVNAHKTILAMTSPVFKAMFYGSMSKSDAVIPIVDIETNVFKSLLVYIYTDVIEIDSSEKACQLYYAAKKYMLLHLTKECITYISKNVNENNALQVFEFAKFNDYEDLMDQCIQVIQRCTKNVLNHSSFTEVSLETVCMVFSMDSLNINSEIELFKAAERYAEANEDALVSPDNNVPSTADEHSGKKSEECVVSPDNKVPPTADDQCEKISEECSAPPENNTSPTPHTQLTEDEARSEATFFFTVPNFTNLKDRVFSKTFYVRNLPWQISMQPYSTSNNYNQTQKTLAVFLSCNRESKSTSWSCYATYELRLICHGPDAKPFCKKTEDLFYSPVNDKAHWDFIPWNDVLDSKNGYMKENTVTLEVHVSAEEPYGILGTSKKSKGSLARKDKLTMRNAVRLIRFLTLTAVQFAEEVAYSKLLGVSDERDILVNILTKKRDAPMPKGFCKHTRTRLKK